VNVEDVAAAVVNRADPPVMFAYHLNAPDTPVDAEMETVPGLHEIPEVPVTVAAVPTAAVTAMRGLVQAGEAVVKLT
jgi:hypothetical protein